MNRNNIYTIFIIICILAVIASYTLITTELKNTTLTPINTKSQPCPDYWTYDSSDNLCYDINNDMHDFSTYTFCDKIRYTKDPVTKVPWNGISNIYNKKCDITVEPQTDNNPDYYENNKEYSYITSIFAYSVLVLLFLFIDYSLGWRGRLVRFTIILIFIEFILSNAIGYRG